jgi:hypothetical protein
MNNTVFRRLLLSMLLIWGGYHIFLEAGIYTACFAMLTLLLLGFVDITLQNVVKSLKSLADLLEMLK